MVITFFILALIFAVAITCYMLGSKQFGEKYGIALLAFFLLMFFGVMHYDSQKPPISEKQTELQFPNLVVLAPYLQTSEDIIGVHQEASRAESNMLLVLASKMNEKESKQDIEYFINELVLEKSYHLQKILLNPEKLNNLEIKNFAKLVGELQAIKNTREMIQALH